MSSGGKVIIDSQFLWQKVVRYDEKKPGVGGDILMGIMGAGGGHPIQ